MQTTYQKMYVVNYTSFQYGFDRPLPAQMQFPLTKKQEAEAFANDHNTTAKISKCKVYKF
jgi:hypothetical protein